MKMSINSVIKESEKAICVEITLEHPRSNKQFTKEQWMPKSVVEAMTETSVVVKDWFANKMMAEQISFMKVGGIMTSIVFKHVVDFGY
jgi:hypothetical protein